LRGNPHLYTHLRTFFFLFFSLFFLQTQSQLDEIRSISQSGCLGLRGAHGEVSIPESLTRILYFSLECYIGPRTQTRERRRNFLAASGPLQRFPLWRPSRPGSRSRKSSPLEAEGKLQFAEDVPISAFTRLLITQGVCIFQFDSPLESST
jgi:hypothetical protein